MQAQTSSRFTEERENKPLQRALLALVLHEFPAQLTREELRWKGLNMDGEALDRAILSLSIVGLLWCQGDFVLPALPARHFHWLEWS
jgi:hypothetical protein